MRILLNYWRKNSMILKIIISGFILTPFLLIFSVKPAIKPINKINIKTESSISADGQIDAENFKFLPVIKDRENIETELENNLFFTSAAVAIVAADQQQLVYKKNIEQRFPIASLTKLMTAIIFIESGIDLNKEIIFSEENNEDLKNYSLPIEIIEKIYVESGDTLKVKDLLYSTLIGSANNAALALAEASGLGKKEFIKRMNERAQSLGLKNTFFKEPTGLDLGNVSTALEIAKLADYAFKNDLIKKVTTASEYSFQTLTAKKWCTVRNTNWLVNNLEGLFGSKTGYLREAGCCVAAGVSNKDKKFIIILMGAKDSQTRFEELKKAADWALSL